MNRYYISYNYTCNGQINFGCFDIDLGKPISEQKDLADLKSLMLKQIPKLNGYDVMILGFSKYSNQKK